VRQEGRGEVRVLLVENHPVFARTVITAFLSGHVVRICPTISEAVEALTCQPFDAVLVDYDLDDGKGDQLVACVRSVNPEQLVIGVSAHRLGNERLLRAGAQAACMKARFAEVPALLVSLARRRRFWVSFGGQSYEGVVLVEGGEDRAAVRCFPWGVAVVVADGAGGTGSGGEAADFAIDRVHHGLLALDCAPEPLELADLLIDVDQTLVRGGLGGESTAAVACIYADQISGASVGDSGVQLIQQEDTSELTRWQRRKPLLGSGRALPTAFGPVGFDGVLLAATDGLLGYLGSGVTRGLLDHDDVEAATENLVDGVRLRSGALPDDVAMVVVRRIGEHLGAEGRR
jgi:PPM family protein phosphatase